MKTATHAISTHLSGFGLFILAACLLSAPPARAGLTVDIHLYHDSYGYYFYPWLNANTNTPNFPTGNYMIASPQIPTNGSQLQYQATNNTLNFITGGGNYYGDFNSFLYGITNGQWSIWVTNSISTNQYKFTVSVSGITSNIFGAPAVAVFPTNGAQFVTNQPLFQWTGPANWAGALNVSDNFIDTNGNWNYEASASLPPNQTSWPCPVQLTAGTNDFSADYTSNVTAQIVASTPLINGSQPISGWVSTATLETHFTYDSQFTVGSPVLSTSSGGHTNVVYYSFEDDNLFAHDFSGHGNDIVGYGWFVSPPYMTNDAAAGSWAVGYTGSGWQSPPTNLVATLAGSFSVSLWAKTSDDPGNDSDTADVGAGLLSANSDQVIPLAQTGSKLAFLTGGGTLDTLHSVTSINTGSYVHLVVTRDQASGEKKIYINGTLDAADSGAPGLLNTASAPSLYLGYNSTLSAGFIGEMDEVQIYSGVLSSNEVMQLYNHPGTAIPDLAGGSNNGLIAHYDFDEGTVVAPDVSGNGNNIVLSGNFGGAGPAISSDAIAGAGSVSFDGGSYLTAPTNLLSTLASSFTISLWVNTTQNYDYQGDYAYNGAGIISADIPGIANDLVPVALTGGQVAFNTGNTQYGYDDTINSSATVNDGSWHHVVVARNQTTGEKDIYIDGVLDTSDFDTTALLDDPQLLTIGAIADASNPDPSSPSYTGYNGYQGLLDDIQIYSRVLSSNEVSFLYDNPGATLSGSSTPPYPVDVNLQFYFIRSQDPNLGEIYGASVSFNSVSPAPTTTNSVHSPNDYFSTEQYPGGGSGSGAILNSLGDVLNEFTNGLWKIYINQDSPTQQVYSFQVSISGLDTNLLRAVRILSPTNGAVDVLANVPFYWNGPTNFSSLSLDLAGVVEGLSLPINATNWAAAPTLSNGNQFFDLNYVSNNFPGVTFTTPVNASSNPVRTWSTAVGLSSEAFSLFFVGPNPTQLINAQRAGTNFQFSFLSQASVTNSVQYRTNLVLGNWLTYSNVTGDGSLKTIPIPIALFNGSKQGFVRISSH